MTAEARARFADLSPDGLTDLFLVESKLAHHLHSITPKRVALLHGRSLDQLILEFQPFAFAWLFVLPVLAALVPVVQVLADLLERLSDAANARAAHRLERARAHVEEVRNREHAIAVRVTSRQGGRSWIILSGPARR